MEFKQQQACQQLINQLYNQEILKNEKEIQIWTQYKSKHEKVIEGLEGVLPELSVNCMVPIGKKALMKGKLTNTNEILVCLGDDYFVKYSNHQAIALAKRRIKKSDEMLKKLEKERNFLELQQILPSNYGAFGSEDCVDLLEYWDEKKLSDWRVEHRKKEKEYRQKLLKSKEEDKKKSSEKKDDADDDLFARLDQLELEEELNNELNGSEINQSASRKTLFEYFGESSENSNQVELKNETEEIKKDNSQVSLIENKDNVNTIIQSENSIKNCRLNDLKDEITKVKKSSTKKEKKRKNVTKTSNKDTKINGKFEVSIIKEEDLEKTLQRPNFLLNSNSVSLESSSDCKKPKSLGRRVSFALNCDNGEKNCKNDNGHGEQADSQCNNSDSANEENDDIIKIDFTHSKTEVEVDEGEDGTILSPKDIYKVFCKPKSILKKTSSPININYNYQNICTIDENYEEENENTEYISNMDDKHRSIYSMVIQDIKEKRVDNKILTDNKSHSTQETIVREQISSVGESSKTQRPMSRFKMQRANLQN